jgi:cytochrome P450
MQRYFISNLVRGTSTLTTS